MKWTICSSCKGNKCCVMEDGVGPIVSKRELDGIKKELNRDFEVKKNGKLFSFVNKGENCLFNNNGCILKENKPLGCEIFPFFPAKAGWTIRMKCRSWNKFNNRLLGKVKKEFYKRKADWGGTIPEKNTL